MAKAPSLAAQSGPGLRAGSAAHDIGRQQSARALACTARAQAARTAACSRRASRTRAAVKAGAAVKAAAPAAAPQLHARAPGERPAARRADATASGHRRLGRGRGRRGRRRRLGSAHRHALAAVCVRSKRAGGIGGGGNHQRAAIAPGACCIDGRLCRLTRPLVHVRRLRQHPLLLPWGRANATPTPPPPTPGPPACARAQRVHSACTAHAAASSSPWTAQAAPNSRLGRTVILPCSSKQPGRAGGMSEDTSTWPHAACARQHEHPSSGTRPRSTNIGRHGSATPAHLPADGVVGGACDEGQGLHLPARLGGAIRARAARQCGAGVSGGHACMCTLVSRRMHCPNMHRHHRGMALHACTNWPGPGTRCLRPGRGAAHSRCGAVQLQSARTRARARSCWLTRPRRRRQRSREAGWQAWAQTLASWVRGGCW